MTAQFFIEQFKWIAVRLEDRDRLCRQQRNAVAKNRRTHPRAPSLPVLLAKAGECVLPGV
jgi:hypothetical protein